MALLIVGCFIFFGVHLISGLPLKQRLTEKLGTNGYKGLYSLGSAVGLIMMIIGYGRAGASVGNNLWTASEGITYLAYALIIPGLFSVVGGNIPGNWQRFFRHPMLMGIILFSAGHLLVNSSPRDLILFGSLAAYSAFAMYSVNRRGPWVRAERSPLMVDAVHVAASLLLIGTLLIWGHQALFGVGIAIS